MQRQASPSAHPAASRDPAAPSEELSDTVTSPSGIALGAMDESDTERESIGGVPLGELPDQAGSSSARHRRRTVVSPIPSLLAATMDGQRRPGAVKVPGGDLQERLARAKAAFSGGDIGLAFHEAEGAVASAEEGNATASPAFRRELPLLMRIYAGFLGDLDAAPILKVSQEVWEAQVAKADERAVLARINGLRTLRDILRDTELDAFRQLRTAACLLSSGLISWT